MPEQIVLSWTKDGYEFSIDGRDIDFPVRSASVEMRSGKFPSVVLEIDASYVRLEHGVWSAPTCGEGTSCILPHGHAGEHDYVSATNESTSEVGD